MKVRGNVKLKFTGDPNNGVRKYVGDGIVCYLEHPDTCILDVPDIKAAQLLTDFPDWFEKVINAFLQKLKKSPRYVTKKQIVEYATAKGIIFDPKMTKKQMIEALL